MQQPLQSSFSFWIWFYYFDFPPKGVQSLSAHHGLNLKQWRHKMIIYPFLYIKKNTIIRFGGVAKLRTSRVNNLRFTCQPSYFACHSCAFQVPPPPAQIPCVSFIYIVCFCLVILNIGNINCFIKFYLSIITNINIFFLNRCTEK